MLFHTVEFLIFFITVYGLYLVLPHHRQNHLLLAASYIFYGLWDWRFLSLILFSTTVDFFCAKWMSEAKESGKRKYLLVVSLITNLGLLGIFKYFNFFTDSFLALLSGIGLHVPDWSVQIVLPVGISFYTFQTLSYTIDVYRDKLRPVQSFSDFMLFVSFFPQLIAGPIERASHLLPQIINPRKVTWNQFREGTFLFFFGLFEKLFIAANLAKITDPVFSDSAPYGRAQVLCALYAFSFQIFCDFDAYSNMARGLGKCMGFDIMVNFRLPYIARNPREFWQRWHISLSTWLRDYLYIPLGGNRHGRWLTRRNLLITMFLGGLWHGAAWTFVLWGLYHGALLIGYHSVQGKREKRPSTTMSSSPRIWMNRLFFFHLVVFGWLLFRAQSLEQIMEMSHALLFGPWDGRAYSIYGTSLLFILTPLWLIQWAQYKSDDLLVILRWPWFYKTVTYALMTYLIIGWGILTPQEFIYFQF